MWLAGLAVLGTGLYFGVAPRLVRRDLEAFLGADPGRVHRSTVLALWPYLAGGAQAVAAGLLNPQSPLLVLISAAAASLGGASLLAWHPRVVARRPAASDAAPVWIPRSTAWVVAAAAVSVLFVVVLGRGIAL